MNENCDENFSELWVQMKMTQNIEIMVEPYKNTIHAITTTGLKIH